MHCVSLMLCFTLIEATNGASEIASKFDVDVSMIMNMLHHDNLRIKNLEKGIQSITDAQAGILKEVRNIKDIMNKRFDGIEKDITSLKKATASVDILIESFGRDDPFNSIKILVNGIDRSLDRNLLRRGWNIVVVDKSSGKFESSVVFDTHGNSNASSDMAKFINNIRDGRIVLVAVSDEGTERLYDDGVAALESVGAIDPKNIGYRGSLALVGYKGSVKRRWVRQVQNKRFKGLSKLRVTIPLYRD